MMNNKDGTLGRPSFVWQFGQERRLNLIQKYVSLKNKKILDVGCGEGLYLKRFKNFTNELYGIDIDEEKIEKIKNQFPNVRVAPAEKLPFPENFFDIILFNEVLEHVEDDKKAIREAFRCLKKGGKIIIFAPNRFYPFETHGIYFKGVYHFGNFPFVNYLPNFLRNKICPHVRAYTKKDVLKLFSGFNPVRDKKIKKEIENKQISNGVNYKILVFTQIYPGFDKIGLRYKNLASLLRNIFYFLEKTPLKIFGLSHFLIVEKNVK